MSSLVAKSFANLLTFTRAASALYVNSAGLLASAATDQPRWDYDPITLLPRGLLIEPARTNLLLRSQAFDNAAWTAIGTKEVTANTHVAPDGTTTACTLADTSAVAYNGIAQSVSIANDSLLRTVSIYVLKTAGGTSPTFGVNVSNTGGTPVSVNVRLNTDTGAVISGTGYVDSLRDWWRLACPIVNNNTGNTSLGTSFYAALNTHNVGTDSTASTGSAVIWGAQVETGEASSYIATTTAAVTRARDICTVTSLSPWLNQAAGTFVLEASMPWTYNANDVASRVLMEIDDGSTNNRHVMYWASGYVQASGYKGGALQYDASTVPPSRNVPWRQALAFAPNDIALVANGGAGNGLRTDTAADIPLASTVVRIGAATAAGYEPHMHVRKLQFYPRRVANNDLVALSRVA